MILTALRRARWAAVLILAALPASAQADEERAPRLQIELNAAREAEAACLISFVVENRLGADLTETVLEAVLFGADGTVERLTLFDFRDLPQGRPRVRQFSIEGAGCGGIGRILINGAETCTGEGLTPAACMDGLDLRSRTDIELVG